ncbi:MAG TPA: serine/threonine-protein kinase, partial [Actinoplanes sp.]
MGRVGRVGKQDASHVGGRYRLVERLGSGGMSVVWHGYDEILGRHVAVKVLSPQLAGDLTFRERLRQEALAAARLCHPNITGIYDFGESVLSDGVTVPYVVMELNDGESVSARVNRQGPLPWADAVTVAAEVASALATAHARGVVHRDVTPANVMLTGAGAKVVDFGISALVGDRDAAPDGSLLGTPAYLAPERLNGGQVSPATDVYALGLVLYRALTGRLPWPAETTTEALRAHLYADPEPIPTLPGMPAEVADLCLRCLAKQPDDRPGAADLAHAFAAAVGLHAVIPPAPATDAYDAELADPVWPTVQLPATAAGRPGLGGSALGGSALGGSALGGSALGGHD